MSTRMYGRERGAFILDLNTYEKRPYRVIAGYLGLSTERARQIALREYRVRHGVALRMEHELLCGETGIKGGHTCTRCGWWNRGDE